VKKKQFFRNFMTIVLFGAVGTLISFVIVSLGLLSFISLLPISGRHEIFFLSMTRGFMYSLL
jgi:hypothetical protein